MKNPPSLVARVYKARYFLDTHLLEVKLGSGSIFIWFGIWKAKQNLKATGGLLGMCLISRFSRILGCERRGISVWSNIIDM